MANAKNVEEIFVDGIQTIGAHNGVVRVQFFSIAPDGSANPALVLLVPQTQLRGVVEGLAKSVR